MDNKCIPGEIAFFLFVGLLLLGRAFLRLFSGVRIERRRGTRPTGFGLSYQLRRRRMDMTKKGNTLMVSIGDKIRRQRQGMLKTKRKRK